MYMPRSWDHPVTLPMNQPNPTKRLRTTAPMRSGRGVRSIAIIFCVKKKKVRGKWLSEYSSLHSNPSVSPFSCWRVVRCCTL